MQVDLTLVEEKSSTTGFKAVTLALPDGHHPVQIRVEGKMPDGKFEMLRDSICHGGETLPLPVNVLFLGGEDLHRFRDIRVLASHAVKDHLSYEERA